MKDPWHIDEALVEKFLARVEALTPAQWGQFDARGERVSGVSPFAMLDHAKLDAATLGLCQLFDLPVATGVALGGRFAAWGAVGVIGLAALLRGRRSTADLAARREEQHRKHREILSRRPHLARSHAWSQHLIQSVLAHPGGPKSILGVPCASVALRYGLFAIIGRPRLSDEVFATAYSIVEPVIPFASLDRSA